MMFHEMQISKPIIEALKRLGLKVPRPIQEQTIPLMLEGRNVVGMAQTGSGKTLAFALPILERINTSNRAPQALVLVPTRELALQVCKVFSTVSQHVSAFSPQSEDIILTSPIHFGVSRSVQTLVIHSLAFREQAPGMTRSFHVKPIRTVAIYGGTPKERQMRAMQSGCQIIVATPGRLIDFMREGKIKLTEVRTVILDEADRMFDMGFINDVKWILSRVRPNAQFGLFSATIPAAIREIIQTHVQNPAYVRLANLAQDKPKISAKFYRIQPNEKFGFLLNLLQGNGSSTLVFCRTRWGADKLAKNLSRSGHRVGVIHGGKNQNQRDRVMNSFRSGGLGILVATDLASRGLDIDDIMCVVNYDVPREPEDYVHRVGRTARAGKAGSAITLVTPMEKEHVQKIEKLTGERMVYVQASSNGH